MGTLLIEELREQNPLVRCGGGGARNAPVKHHRRRRFHDKTVGSDGRGWAHPRRCCGHNHAGSSPSRRRKGTRGNLQVGKREQWRPQTPILGDILSLGLFRQGEVVGKLNCRRDRHWNVARARVNRVIGAFWFVASLLLPSERERVWKRHRSKRFHIEKVTNIGPFILRSGPGPDPRKQF
jgi:hypothetical protein